MEKDLEKIIKQAKDAIRSSDDNVALDRAISITLGKNGLITRQIKSLAKLTYHQKKKIGPVINQAKYEIEDEIEKKKIELLALQKGETIDISLPGKKFTAGHLHPITKTIDEIVEIFHRLGFVRVSYPEIEWDYYAFESLNMPKDHPARDEWETFFISQDKYKLGSIVLTPHTSSGQIREMEKGQMPIRMLNVGKCYRRQQDISHTPMFHQFEGLLIDRNISITHLKGVLDFFVNFYFGPNRQVRLRPFHFRFTEPSFEVDITCGICKGSGCRLCTSGWLELGGAGMVHPKVLAFGKINPKIYTGFAFGWGIERIITLKQKIPDIRILYQNDLRILNQF